jgi:hypothetical protein
VFFESSPELEFSVAFQPEPNRTVWFIICLQLERPWFQGLEFGDLLRVGLGNVVDDIDLDVTE